MMLDENCRKSMGFLYYNHMKIIQTGCVFNRLRPTSCCTVTIKK